MSTLTYRATKGSPLSSAEGDANVQFLNDRAEANGFDIRRFVSGSGTTATQATFASALDAMPATGGTLRIPAGANVVLSAPIMLNKALHLVGDGKAAMYRTNISSLVKIDGSFSGIIIQKGGTRISGLTVQGLAPLGNFGWTGSTCQGIRVDIKEPIPADLTNTYGPLPGSYSIDYVTVYNVRDGIWQENGQEGQISFCDFQQFSRYGLTLKNTLLHDGGDMSIVGCNFYTDNNILATAGVYQTDGGGAKFMSNKWNQRFDGRMDYCYLGEVSANTSILQFAGTNSMENYSKAGVKINSAGFGLVQIEGIEYAPYWPSAEACIDLKGVLGLYIGNNMFVKSASPNLVGIKLRECSTYTISPNTYLNFSAPSAGQDIDGSNINGRNFDTDTVGTSQTTTPTGPVATAPAGEQTFTDNFVNATGARWVETGGVTRQNGLTLAPAPGGEAGEAKLLSNYTYNMVNKRAVCHFASVVPNTDVNNNTNFWIGDSLVSSAKTARFSVQAAVLYAQYGYAHGTFQNLAYDPIAHAYLGITLHSDNTVLFEVSPNGSNWSTYFTLALQNIIATAAKIGTSARSNSAQAGSLSATASLISLG